VALLQWRLHMNIEPYLGHIPGFTADGAEALQVRDGLTRVTGTGIDSIELGVTAAMLLPICIWAAKETNVQVGMRRWAPVLLAAICVPATVSRAAVIGVLCAFGLFLILMPARQRVNGFSLAPLAIVAVFLGSHGELSILTSSFTGASSDSSVTHRTNNYPYVEHLVSQSPWLGTGGGTYLPAGIHILDNQYLTTTIELGLIGAGALICFFLVPMLVALGTRKRSRDPSLRLLCSALAAAVFAGAVCSACFDSFSFPLFYNVYALAVGVIGACWRIGQRESAEGHTPTTRPNVAARFSDFPMCGTRRFVTPNGN